MRGAANAGRTTGAGALVAALRAAGVEVVFGLPGVHNMAAWRALEASPIRLVCVRHEQAAGYAADGYARATGRLGVALVTTGPGAANTLGAVGEAWASRSPVLVIATDIPTALREPGVHRGALHEVPDQHALFAPVTKAVRRPATAAAIAEAAAGACATALTAPARPVYLELPTDLLSEPVAAPDPGALARAAAPLAAPAPDPAALARAAEALDRAERPLIWAGGGAQAAAAGPAVARLAERLAAPVVTTYSARGVIGDDHPWAVALPPHVPEVGRLWDEADLVVAIGSDLDGMMTQNWLQPDPPALLAINLDRDDATKNYPAEVLEGDAAAATAALAEAVADRERPSPLGPLRDAAWRRLRGEHPEELRFLAAVLGAVPDDATVVADMCIPGYWLASFHRVPGPRLLQYPMGWGTLGYAFPAALGAAFGAEGPVVSFSGDGGFLYAPGELATAAQERPALTAVVVDDGGYGMLGGMALHTPDFTALARAFGVRAEAVDGLGEPFAAALARHVADAEPTVLVARARLRPPPTTSPHWYRRAVAR